MLAELELEDAATGKLESQRMLFNLATGHFGAGEAKTTMRGGKPLQVSRPLPAESRPTVTEDNDGELQMAWGDVSGRELDPGKVRKARAEEVEYIHKSNLYTKVSRRKTLDAGANVISVRWLDINKGDAIL